MVLALHQVAGMAPYGYGRSDNQDEVRVVLAKEKEERMATYSSDKSRYTLEEINAAFSRWMSLPHPLYGCLFLERHPELLSSRCRVLVDQMIADYPERAAAMRHMLGEAPEEVDEELKSLRDHLLLLRDIYRRGGTIRAIHEAYINFHGGLILDVPAWIQTMQEQLNQLTEEGLTVHMLTQGCAILRKAIARASTDTQLLPEIRAELSFLLQEALKELPDADTPPVQEERITCLRKAFEVYTFDRYPYRYADISHSLRPYLQASHDGGYTAQSG